MNCRLTFLSVFFVATTALGESICPVPIIRFAEKYCADVNASDTKGILEAYERASEPDVIAPYEGMTLKCWRCLGVKDSRLEQNLCYVQLELLNSCKDNLDPFRSTLYVLPNQKYRYSPIVGQHPAFAILHNAAALTDNDPNSEIMAKLLSNLQVPLFGYHIDSSYEERKDVARKILDWWKKTARQTDGENPPIFLSLEDKQQIDQEADRIFENALEAYGQKNKERGDDITKTGSTRGVPRSSR